MCAEHHSIHSEVNNEKLPEVSLLWLCIEPSVNLRETILARAHRGEFHDWSVFRESVPEPAREQWLQIYIFGVRTQQRKGEGKGGTR